MFGLTYVSLTEFFALTSFFAGVTHSHVGTKHGRPQQTILVAARDQRECQAEVDSCDVRVSASGCPQKSKLKDTVKISPQKDPKSRNLVVVSLLLELFQPSVCFFYWGQPWKVLSVKDALVPPSTKGRP